MTTAPVRLDRLQAGIIAWLDSVFPSPATVLWSPTVTPRASAGGLVVTAKLLAPPSASPLGGASRTTRLVPTTTTVRVLAVSPGADVALRASGLRWEVPCGVDVEATRDALLAAVEASSTITSFGAVASGTDRIVLTPTAIGDLYNVSARGSAAGLIEIESQTTTLAQCTMVDVRSYVQIEAWSTSRSPHTGAAAALTRLLVPSRLHDAQEILGAYGVSMIGAPPAPTELDELSGPDWTSRAQVSMYFGQVALAAAAILPIERARGTINVPGASPDAVVTIDTEPPS